MAQQRLRGGFSVINHEAFRAVERIFILLLPFRTSTISFIGLLFTNISLLMVIQFLNHSLSTVFKMFDSLFWVERVACMMLWSSLFVEGIYQTAIFILYSSMIIRLYFPTEIKMKRKEMVTEIGTQTEKDSQEEQHKISQKLVKKELAKKTNEEQKEKNYFSVASKDNYEREISEVVILFNEMVIFMEKILSDVEWLMKQVRVISDKWEEEKQELQRHKELCYDWKDKISDYYLKIRTCEEEIVRLEGERSEMAKKLEEESATCKSLKYEIENERSAWKGLESDFVYWIGMFPDDLRGWEREKSKMTKNLQEKEAMALEFMERCQKLEEENLSLHARLHATNELSKFYKTLLRNIDI